MSPPLLLCRGILDPEKYIYIYNTELENKLWIQTIITLLNGNVSTLSNKHLSLLFNKVPFIIQDIDTNKQLSFSLFHSLYQLCLPRDY
jgi:hypothetical protein